MLWFSVENAIYSAELTEGERQRSEEQQVQHHEETTW